MVSVPIIVEGTGNTGSLHVEIIYNSTKLRATSVKKGQLAIDSLFMYNMDTPGLVVLGVVNSKGLKGNGEIAIIDFKVTGSDSVPIPVNLENAIVCDVNTLDQVFIDTVHGSITPKGPVVQSPRLLLIQD